MDRVRLINRLRRTRLAWAFAACLVALTICPFTAPFASVNIIELITDAPHSLSASKAELKNLSDTYVHDVAATAEPRTSDVVSPLRTASQKLILTRTTVLRI